jgi:hypothetical protein
MKREIGIIGTTARVIIGTWLAGSVLYGHLVRDPFRPLPCGMPVLFTHRLCRTKGISSTWHGQT